MSRPRAPVSILLLGSGWTSQFLLPALREAKVSYAYTKRAIRGEDDAAEAIPFTYEQGRSDYTQLPAAEMVAVIFPLTSDQAVDELISGYEAATKCQPAWLALGSTGAWSKGNITSSTPITATNIRATSEQHLLSLSSDQRPTAVLNLSGLYGANRNPVNFAKKVGDTKEKLEGKTSLHLVHGKDVAQAIVAMYQVLQDGLLRNKMWAKRWIVTGEREEREARKITGETRWMADLLTDTYVYDWWQLFTTLRPMPHTKSQEWVQDLMQKYGVTELPRKMADSDAGNTTASRPPFVLDRAMDGQSFWNALGKRPLVGRCDDYSEGGGGIHPDKEEKSRESL